MHLDHPWLDHPDAPDLAHPAQIIALQINNHVELGQIFRAVGRRLAHSRLQRSRAFDRPGRDTTALRIRLHAEEQLWRVAEQRTAGRLKKRPIPRGILSEQPLVDLRWLACAQTCGKPLREIHLKHIPRTDIFDHPLNSLLICKRGKVAGQGRMVADELGRRCGFCRTRTFLKIDRKHPAGMIACIDTVEIVKFKRWQNKIVSRDCRQ